MSKVYASVLGNVDPTTVVGDVSSLPRNSKDMQKELVQEIVLFSH